MALFFNPYKILIVAVFLIHTITAFSQEIKKEIPIEKEFKVRQVQFFNFGDTVLLNLKGFNTKIYQPEERSLIAIPGEQELWELKFVPFGQFNICFAITISSTTKRFYYIEKDKDKLYLKAFDLNVKSMSTVSINSTFEIKGSFMGIIQEEDKLIVYSIDKNKNTFFKTVISELNEVDKVVYNLPVGLSGLRDEDIAIISDGTYLTAIQAKARVKIYLGKKEINILADNAVQIINESMITSKQGSSAINRKPAANSDNNAEPETVLITINSSTGDVISSQTFPGPKKGKFSSTMLDSYIFRTVNRSDVFELNVFNSNTRDLLVGQQIPKDTTNRNYEAYFRSAKDFTVYKESFNRMMKYSSISEPFVIVTREDTSGKYLITWGTYFNENGTGSAGGGDPITMLFTMVVTTTIKQMQEGPGVSRYFYMTGTPETSFSVTNGVITTRSKIDNYEIEKMNKKVKYSYKGYFEFRNGIYGVYHEEKNSMLKIVRF